VVKTSAFNRFDHFHAALPHRKLHPFGTATLPLVLLEAAHFEPSRQPCPEKAGVCGKIS
jgi:hypothetical protein